MDDRAARQRSGILTLCFCFLIGGPWLLWSQRAEFRAAMARYEAAPAAPLVEFVVDGRSSEIRGGGRSRSKHYFIELVPAEHFPGLVPTVVEVSETTYTSVGDGERWKARLAAGQPVFDPLITRLELDRSRTAKYAGFFMIGFALLLLWLHRSGRLYRAL